MINHIINYFKIKHIHKQILEDKGCEFYYILTKHMGNDTNINNHYCPLYNQNNTCNKCGKKIYKKVLFQENIKRIRKMI